MTDFDDLVEYRSEVRRIGQQLDSVEPRVEVLERLVAELQLRLQTTAALVKEESGGVFNSDDWRERLKRRGLGERVPAMKAAAETGVFTAQQIDDLKAVGSFLFVQRNDEGPCYNRDDNATTEGT